MRFKKPRIDVTYFYKSSSIKNPPEPQSNSVLKEKIFFRLAVDVSDKQGEALAAIVHPGLKDSLGIVHVLLGGRLVWLKTY